MAFALTNDSTPEIADDHCTVHSVMDKTVVVDASTVNYTLDTGSTPLTTLGDDTVVTAPVSFEMTVSNITVERASSGVDNWAGHLHILVDQPAVEPDIIKLENNDTLDTFISYRYVVEHEHAITSNK